VSRSDMRADDRKATVGRDHVEAALKGQDGRAMEAAPSVERSV
jgi:hypothetical protein